MTRSCQSRREFLATLAGTLPVWNSPALHALGTPSEKPRSSSRRSRSSFVTIRPGVCDEAFANPLKGFRTDLPSDGGSGKGLDNPLITLARHYIRWNQIEQVESDTVDKVLEFCNSKWDGIEKRNRKIIPRVYLFWPEKSYWPSDLRAGDYGSTRFLHRLGNLIFKLGTAWDRDPRVAYVETGIVGPCGEQWGPTPHFELKKVIGDSYSAAFRHKLCMIRYPWHWADYNFGVFWDSWGTRKDTARMLEVLESPALRDSWKSRVRGGEISYGFGDPPGQEPNDTMADAGLVDWVECLTRRGHWNHLGWVSEYDWRRADTIAQGQRMQKAFGHRFVMEEARYPARAACGETVEVEFTVRNTGSSPFYYNWPVALALLHEQSGELLWQQVFDGVDVRKWLPGDGWTQFAEWSPNKARFVLDSGLAHYELTPVLHRESGRFTLPEKLPRGRHMICVGILDPSGLLPCCRFAVTNYIRGGWHPLGRIAIDVEPGDTEIDPARFSKLSTDTSIHYTRS